MQKGNGKVWSKAVKTLDLVGKENRVIFKDHEFWKHGKHGLKSQGKKSQLKLSYFLI